MFFNNYQYIKNKVEQCDQSSKCCWCRCDEQVEPVAASDECGFYVHDDDFPNEPSEWADWGECTPSDNHLPCGFGKRERVRRCQSSRTLQDIITVEDVENFCYIPRIKRKTLINMKDNKAYYQSENCHKNCPQHFILWQPWSNCFVSEQSLNKNKMRIRYGRQNSNELSQIDKCEKKEKNRGKSRVITGTCSVSCGEGRRTDKVYNYDKRRWEYSIPVKCGNGYCPLIDFTGKTCPMFSTWDSNWSNWSACSASCGDTAQRFRRQCRRFEDGVTACDGPDCTARGRTKCTNTEYGPCGMIGETIHNTTLKCPECTCTAHSGSALTAEMRPCGTEIGVECKPCNTDVCSAGWSAWSQCTATCDNGSYKKRTACYKYTDGEQCVPDTKKCSFVSCPIIKYTECKCSPDSTITNFIGIQCQTDNPSICIRCEIISDVCGQYESDLVTTPCTATCGDGYQTISKCFKWKNPERARECRTETKSCNVADCPIWGRCQCTSDDRSNLSAEQCDQFSNCVSCTSDVCGKQFVWSTWSSCSVTCGNGTRGRKREFRWTQDNRIEEDIETETCAEIDTCPHWTEWTEYGLCSALCKSGSAIPIKTRSRCWNDNTNECKTPEQEEIICNTQPCSQACEWQEWNQWSACTPNCSSGMKTRTREGTNACTEARAEGRTCSSENPPLDNCPACVDKYAKCNQIRNVTPVMSTSNNITPPQTKGNNVVPLV